MKSNVHIPVLLDEVISGLNIKSNGYYVDMTMGRAGHSRVILSKIKDGFLLDIDQDDEAIEYSTKFLKETGTNFKIVKANFKDIGNVLDKEGVKEIDGALYDLGVSSPQFDEGYRGFSYRFDAPLDMRMDLEKSLTAKEVVNTYSLKDLTRIFRDYGEEKDSYQIAKNILKTREIKPIETTFELVDVIKKSKTMKELRKPGHPAKQIFQALRIEVNNELGSLQISLEDVINRLKVGGRICVITFQSLEDRIVKNLFKKYSVVEGNRVNDFISSKDIKTPDYKEVNRHVIIASEDEIKENPRSKSAKLRILERLK
jgi:16S rRNA (cytosine1402-N4)-methyltransferase